MKKSFKSFLVLWGGQFFSILGSGLSAFGLSVWLYNETGAATPFAMSFLCNLLPGIIFAPVAGSFADRKNRKMILVATDSLDALLKVLMVGLLLTGSMRVWMVYPILFLSSTFSTFQAPAYSASIPMLVEEDKLSKANGLIQMSNAAQSMIAPALAGALYPFLGLSGLLMIDFGTFLIGIFTALITKIPQSVAEATESKGMKLIVKDFGAAMKLIREKNGFLTVIIVFSILNFVANIAMVLVGPMVMANYSSVEFGNVETIYAAAMLLGGLLATVMPKAKNLFGAMFAILSISGVGLIVSGFTPYWIIIGVGMFIFFLGVPYANTLFQTGLQTSFDSNSLGRVGSLISALLKIASPLACIFSGPIIDNVLEPFMSNNGTFGYEVIGNYIGTGAGRGIGLMFIICGVVLSTLCIVMAFRFSGNYATLPSNECTQSALK